MTVWVFVVSSFLTVGDGQPALLAQARLKTQGTFVLPTPESCEAARQGVREFAQTANETLLIGRCLEEERR